MQPRGTIRVPFLERFWSKVRKSDEADGCWVWTGGKSREGYGQIFVSHGKYAKAHRCSYEIEYGPIPEGLDCLHRCDNPPCVRPEHLWLGTAKDNSRDMYEKGRQSTVRARPERLARGDRHGSRTHPESLVRGSQHYRSKLTEEKVAAIREEWKRRAETEARGKLSREMALRHGVSHSTIEQVVYRLTWTHVE